MERRAHKAADPCDVCGSRDPFRPIVRVSLSGVLEADIAGCAACGFRQIRPRLSAPELRALYPDAYFDPAADIGFADYARQQGRSAREAYFFARSFRATLAGRDVLEVGCALGFFLAALRRCSGARVRGIDVSPFAAYFARRRYGLDVDAATIEEARFPDRSFDVVVQKDLLEHVLHPRRHLEETFRILRPGGVTWLVTPNGEMNVRPLVKRAAAEKAQRSGMLPMIEQGHLSFFTRGNLVRLFRESGFEIVRFENVHIKRGLRALGWLPAGRSKSKAVPARGLLAPSTVAAGTTAAGATAAGATAASASAETMEALYGKLTADLDSRTSALRASTTYFHLRHLIERWDALPAFATIGLDFDCLLRRPG